MMKAAPMSGMLSDAPYLQMVARQFQAAAKRDHGAPGFSRCLLMPVSAQFVEQGRQANDPVFALPYVALRLVEVSFGHGLPPSRPIILAQTGR
jgi:hypothetical protein